MECTRTDRTSLRAAALAATALLIACTGARADPGGQTPGPVTADTQQSAHPAAPAESTAPGERLLDTAATEESPQPQASPDASAPGAAPAPAEDGAGTVSQEPPPSPPPSPTSSPSPEASESAPPGGAGDAPGQLLGGIAARAPEPGTTTFVSPPVPVEPFEPEARGGSLGQVLTGVARKLRTLRAQIDDLRRRLEHGAALPRNRLARLRSTLERIAPALAALGVRSPELRRLLRALESFRALSAQVVPGAGPAPSQSGAGTPHIHARPANAAARWQAPAAAPEGQVAGRRQIAPRGGGQPDEPPPWSPAPGSTTASPGGGFAAASVALLAVLLIAAAQAQNGGRLQLQPRRRYAAAFPSPLERPG